MGINSSIVRDRFVERCHIFGVGINLAIVDVAIVKPRGHCDTGEIRAEN